MTADIDEDSDGVSVSTNELTPISCILCKKDSCRRLFCSFNTYWRCLIMIFIVFFYTVVGGAIFNAVERPNELQSIKDAEMTRVVQREALIDLLVNSSSMTEEQAANLTDTIIFLSRLASEVIPAESNPIWDFSSAMFFASTVITTIGYGSIAPSTAAGQIIFMFYAIVGIPLALIFLSQIGTIIDHWLNRALRPVERRWGSSISRGAGSILLFLVTLIFFIVIPAAIYYAIEDWNYRESVYYAIVTLTTVGFGDFVPGQAVEGIGGLNSLYKVISSAWLWIGLAFVSALLSEIQNFIQTLGMWCHKQNVKAIKKFKLKKLSPEKKELTGVGSEETSPTKTVPQGNDNADENCDTEA